MMGRRRIRRSPPQKAEWLLREGDAERPVAPSERVVIDDDHWRAVSERIDVGTGMRIFLTSAEVRRPVTLMPRQSVPGTWLAANVAVSGSVEVTTSDGTAATVDGERSVLFRPVDRAPSYTPAAGETLKLAGYMLRADRVMRIFAGAVPEPVKPLVATRLSASIMMSLPSSRRLRNLALTLFAPGLNGPLRTVFMEGVVLQLFAIQATADHRAHAPMPAAPLSAREKAAVERARERLLADMRDTPTLGDLAAEAEMSEKALNAAFRARYGATVFEILRDERLEHARLALETEAVAIKTIAFRVGYNHVTNFISAFAARYGAPPRQYSERAKAG